MDVCTCDPQEETFRYILNTPIPLSTASLHCSLPAPAALITAGNEAVQSMQKKESQGVGVGQKSRWYLFSPVAASGSLPFLYLLISCRNIAAGLLHIAFVGIVLKSHIHH